MRPFKIEVEALRPASSTNRYLVIQGPLAEDELREANGRNSSKTASTIIKADVLLPSFLLFLPNILFSDVSV